MLKLFSHEIFPAESDVFIVIEVGQHSKNDKSNGQRLKRGCVSC